MPVNRLRHALITHPLGNLHVSIGLPWQAAPDGGREPNCGKIAFLNHAALVNVAKGNGCGMWVVNMYVTAAQLLPPNASFNGIKPTTFRDEL